MEAVAFNRDARYLAYCMRDKDADIVRVADGATVKSVPFTPKFTTLAWHPLRDVIALGGEGPWQDRAGEEAGVIRLVTGR